MSGSGEIRENEGETGPWSKIKKSSPPQELRRPCSNQNINIPNSNENSTEVTEQVNNSDESQNHKVVNSTLNVNAVEFVPCKYQNCYNEIQTNEEPDDIVKFLKSELELLTLSPGKYEDMVEPIGAALTPYMTDESIVKAVADVLIEECISEPNLRYNGVRLCNDLHMKFESFRTPLLQKCQEVYKSIMQSPNDPKLPERIGGFAMLLAELYLQIKVGGQNLQVLGHSLLDLINLILSHEIDSRVKHVCQIFKLAGSKLDELASEKIETLFIRLKEISLYPDLDPNLRFIIESVINMRATNWGNFTSPQSAPAESNSYSECYNDPVFYGPDGQVISEEETSFLQDNVPLSEDVDDYVCEQDSMDEEAYTAYEEFLQMKTSQQNHQ